MVDSQNWFTILLKRFRNSVSDGGAELICRFPWLERPFGGIGPVCSSQPLLRVFYRRTVKTLCERWKEKKRHFRKICIGTSSFLFDVTDFTVCDWHFYRHLFEPETTQLISQTVQPGETVLDIGANRGYFSVLAGIRVGPSGHVYSFEPNPTIFRCLQKHLRINNLAGHVEASTFALSRTRTHGATFFISNLESNSGLSSLTPISELLDNKSLSHEHTIPVETISLDEWIYLKSIDQPIDFIKIDVEGAEMLVLAGATETLAKRPPKRLVIETDPEGAAVMFLRSHGYSTKVLDPAGTHANILFLHPSYEHK
jgi:FkbM family methyltransferase